jgi:hypothetical protein
MPDSAMFCEHANETPHGVCTCPTDCPCRVEMCAFRLTEEKPKAKKTPTDMTRFRTPEWLWLFLFAKYKFTLDAAAEAINAKLPNFIDKAMDAFKTLWKGRVFCNPPYGDKTGPTTAEWVERGYEQARTVSELVCMLIPIKPDTDLYHERIRLGELVKEERFTDPRGKLGIYQMRYTEDMFIETWEFRQRIPFDTDEGPGKGSGWLASVAVVYRRRKV